MAEQELLSRSRLTDAIFRARAGFRQDDSVNPDEYVKLWREDDVAPWGATRALTCVMRTRGCTWDYKHSCTMCGYFVDVLPKKLKPQNLIRQYESVERQHEGEEVLKLYTGGNFLDPHEVFPEAQSEILLRAATRFRKITVETRPEYVTDERVGPLVEALAQSDCRLELALGLESSSRVVCEQAINKGYAFEEFVKGASAAKRLGADVKTYLLLKPPFLTEDEAVEDAVSSIRDAAPYSGVVSLNPTNVQKHTLVDQMFRRREYRPPWLWSILEALARGKPLAGDVIVKSDPVGGGKSRGAHNCGSCDGAILHWLGRYNSTQDVAFLEKALATSCPCRAEYDAVRRLEGLWGGSHYVDAPTFRKRTT